MTMSSSVFIFSFDLSFSVLLMPKLIEILPNRSSLSNPNLSIPTNHQIHILSVPVLGLTVLILALSFSSILNTILLVVTACSDLNLSVTSNIFLHTFTIGLPVSVSSTLTIILDEEIYVRHIDQVFADLVQIRVIKLVLVDTSFFYRFTRDMYMVYNVRPKVSLSLHRILTCQIDGSIAFQRRLKSILIALRD